jgi:feruloyl esterase
MQFMTPPNPSDLSVLKNRGAKVIVYHGVGDAVFSFNDTVAWYWNLAIENRRDPRNFARLFAVPGMNHCAGGPATDQFDLLAPLVKWVEQGQAPEAVVASARGAGNAGGVNAEVPSNWSATRTRPLCSYPQVARYKGRGSLESAANFVCQ